MDYLLFREIWAVFAESVGSSGGIRRVAIFGPDCALSPSKGSSADDRSGERASEVGRKFAQRTFAASLEVRIGRHAQGLSRVAHAEECAVDARAFLSSHHEGQVRGGM